MTIDWQICGRLATMICVGTMMFAVAGAGAQVPVPGEPASLVLRYYDAVTGESVTIPGGRFIRSGSRLRVEAEVYDGYGARADLDRYPCTPQYSVDNLGSAAFRESGRIEGDILEITNQQGPFRVDAQCAENPQVRASSDQITASTSQMSPLYGEAVPETVAPETAAASGGGAGTGLLIGGIVAAGALAGVALASGLGGDSDSGSSCPTFSSCCGGGSVACSIVLSCNCPSGTTDVGSGGSGLRQCVCN